MQERDLIKREYTNKKHICDVGVKILKAGGARFTCFTRYKEYEY